MTYKPNSHIYLDDIYSPKAVSFTASEIPVRTVCYIHQIAKFNVSLDPGLKKILIIY